MEYILSLVLRYYLRPLLFPYRPWGILYPSHTEKDFFYGAIASIRDCCQKIAFLLS
jgi:hypothetical protein